MERVMLELIAAVQRGIDVSQAAADDLGEVAAKADGQLFGSALLDQTRRRRVEVLKLQGMLAALEVEHTMRFGVPGNDPIFGRCGETGQGSRGQPR